MEAKKTTHTIRTDIVDTGAEVKRIELDFCRTDHWSECWPGMMNIAEMLQSGINLMICSDGDSVGRQETIINKLTCEEVSTAIICPVILKPEYIISK